MSKVISVQTTARKLTAVMPASRWYSKCSSRVLSLATDCKKIHIFKQKQTKAKAYNAYVAPQAAYCSLSGAYVTDRAGVQRISCSLNPSPRTLTCDQTAIRSHGLPFNGLQLRNPCNYMVYYSFTDPKGMEGWAGLVGSPKVNTLPTKW